MICITYKRLIGILLSCCIIYIFCINPMIHYCDIRDILFGPIAIFNWLTIQEVATPYNETQEISTAVSAVLCIVLACCSVVYIFLHIINIYSNNKEDKNS